MNYQNFDYEALDKNGKPYWRKALIIGEMPCNLRREALDNAAKIIQKIIRQRHQKLSFGLPIFWSLNMTLSQAKAHPQSEILLKTGYELPISLLASP
jgi:hypothetical protein